MEALEVLFGTYWQPLYRYLRRSGHSEPDAQDLVQGFIAHLLGHNGLHLVDRTKGRFRAFLLGWQRKHRLKRGGFATHLSIDWKCAETGLGIDPIDPRSPDLLYDRDWALALLDKVLNDLEREEKDFDRWKPFLSLSAGYLSYVEIAVQFGLSEGAARVAVHRLRKLYRKRLRQEISRTLAGPEMIEDEMRALFAALSG